MKSVLIIGGGLSGLAAAVELASSGYHITLLEQRRHLGGRAYSFTDKYSGDEVDNGQHIMLGCYHNTFRYLKTIGSSDKLTVEPDLHIVFRHPEKGKFSLDCPPLPAPFHLMAGLSRLRSISSGDKWRILRILPDLVLAGAGREQELEQLTVDEWLTLRGQSETMKKYLWNLIAIATLNDSPAVLSAGLFIEVLRKAFLKKRTDSSFVFSKTGLSGLFVDDAVRFLADRNVKIIKGVDADRFEIREGKITGVCSGSGEYFTADIVVSSVPFYAVGRILKNSDLQGRLQVLTGPLDLFTSSPIISIHLWFDRVITEERFAGLLDTRVHWVFNKTAIQGKSAAKGQYLSLVISGAQDYIDLKGDILIAMANEELKSVFPEAKTARLIGARVVKERRATFSARPGINAFRPSVKTDIPNLFLAGDWTDTGLPATIEGAVGSGFTAAKNVKEIEG